MAESAIKYSFDTFKYLGRRSILPLLSERAATDTDLPDLSNIQGDVVYLFPKKAENFIFFRINNVAAFKIALDSFKPTSSEDVKDALVAINNAKASAWAGREATKTVDVSQYQIAFTRMGLNFLGVRESTGDVRFDRRCMRDDKNFLGDQRVWDKIFDKSSYDEHNGSVNNDEGALHGVITVAGSSADNCTQSSNDVIKLFGSSIAVAGGAAVEGRTRPDPYKGHEHFGFQDGISQPAPRGLVAPRPGQIQVDPGVIIMGYPGDPVLDDPNKVKRPSWTKDGSMLVFRKLEQSVIPFEDYLKKNGPRWREFIPGGDISPPLTDQQGSDLFGARLIGRWKSGAPLAKCPFKDDPVLAVDPNRNNDFDYVVRDNPNISPNEPSAYYCPFTIHTRKTAPRNLDPFLNQKYVESGSIVRGGLPYGPEVTDQERRDVASGTSPEKPRGLLFNCYMSSLDQGFVRQTAYASNDFFPLTSLVPTKHGQDPIIGGPPPDGSSRAPRRANLIDGPPNYSDGDQVDLRLTNRAGSSIDISGFAKVTAQGAQPPPGEPNPYFVTSRGGEYFFVPSISTLKSWAAESDPLLDIALLLDATGGMQKYIAQVCDCIQSICDELVVTGKWSRRNIRFAVVTFRDHPPEEKSYVTNVYPFNNDVHAVEANLAHLIAKGGGDGPEAQSDALAAAVSGIAWKDNATKIAILITDSPPHGIGEDEDKIPGGCPAHNDPIRLAKRMANGGITLHVLACEPTLSSDFSTPLDFYTGIAQKTGGRLLGLTDVQALTQLIIGSVLETADIEMYVAQQGDDIRRKAIKQSAKEISNALYIQLSSEKARVATFTVENIYEANAQGDLNAQVWFNAEELDEKTRAKIKDVKGFRLKQPYRSATSPAPAMSLKSQPISLDQVRTIVMKSIARGAD